MRILAIDTTSHFGSLALARDGEAVDQVLLHAPDGFGHILFEQVSRLLKRNAWAIEEIDCFAAASGPGSFTGVRVGLAAVKGLAEPRRKPVAAVSNLQALASLGTAPLRAALLDARRGEVFGAVYDAGLALVVPETVAGFTTWLKSVPPGGVEFIAQDFSPFRPALAGTPWERAPVVDGCRLLAPAIARIAALRLARGDIPDSAAVDANYVRRSDAELYWKDG